MADNSLSFESAQSQSTNEQHDWKPVAGYEGRYEVSRLGRVRSLLTNRILLPGPNSKNYLCIVMYDGSVPKKPKTFLLHRVVAAAFVGDLTPGMQTNHIDGNKRNCRADNLEIVTQRENIDHARANGLSPRIYRGSDNVRSKLKDEDVKLMKVMLSLGITPAMIGRAFGFSPTTIQAIVTGKTWSHIPTPKITFE